MTSADWAALRQLGTYLPGTLVSPSVFGEALWGKARRDPRTNRFRRKLLMPLREAAGKVLIRLQRDGYAEFVSTTCFEVAPVTSSRRTKLKWKHFGWRITEAGRTALETALGSDAVPAAAI